MIDFKVKLIAGLVVALFLAMLIGYQAITINSLRQSLVKPLPENIKSQVVVDRGQLVYQTKNKSISLKLSKGQPTKVIETTEGEIQVQGFPIWMPSIVALPHLGVSLGRGLEPLIGCQVIRLQQLGIGLSANLQTSGLSLSLDTDVLSNSLLGLQYGINWEGQSFLGLHFSLFF